MEPASGERKGWRGPAWADSVTSVLRFVLLIIAVVGLSGLPASAQLPTGPAGGPQRVAADLVADGRLRPLLDDQRFGLFDAEAAHARAESGDVVGKVTLARDDA